MFPTQLADIENRIKSIDPKRYGATRNFKDGAVTRLSPYISRGVISTKQVFQYVLSLNLPWPEIEKLVQELAWRDYWQQVWIAKGDAIDRDLKHPQQPVIHSEMPKAIVKHNTGIEAMDNAIASFYETGYMHNHMRMYVASVCCNIAQAHWWQPAKWLYSHLLDGDWASNALSWQWVAGSNANKKYYANQENINRYFDSEQKGTFLDVGYDDFEGMPVPDQLKETVAFTTETKLPTVPKPELSDRPTCVYNYYNLDPKWHEEEDVQRVLLLEPSFFKRYPVTDKCIDFALQLSENIPELKLFVGQFSELQSMISPENIIFKEHPNNSHYEGKEEPRDWMFEVKGYYSSFFAFWKKCKKERLR